MSPTARLATTGTSIVALLATVGCSTSGLSAHESGEQSAPMMMYTAADTGVPTVAPVSIRTPLMLGLAQVGEVTPPEPMLAALRARPNLFARVLPVGGRFGEGEDTNRPPLSDGRQTTPAGPSARDQLTHMRSMAATMGLDYLLVFGGSIDHGSQGSGLQLLDLTIVGAFVVPSHGVSVDGRAVGSLIDVRTGQIVLSFGATAKGTGAAPSAFVGSVEQGSVMRNRDELVAKLTDDIIAQVGDEAKYNARAAAGR